MNIKKKARGGRRILETVQVRNNLVLTARERGKIIARREGHNIWLDLGREYLASLMTYATLGPDVAERNDRIKYIGLGIGGNRQLALPTANAIPLVTAYPGSNAQTDIDATVVSLERPVRVSGGSTPYPGNIATDIWMGTVTAPAVHATATQVTYSRLFALNDISYNPFLTVPLSEVMLFTSAADPTVHDSTGMAYDTFDTLSKTNAFDLQIDWTVRY